MPTKHRKLWSCTLYALVQSNHKHTPLITSPGLNPKQPLCPQKTRVRLSIFKYIFQYKSVFMLLEDNQKHYSRGKQTSAFVMTWWQVMRVMSQVSSSSLAHLHAEFPRHSLNTLWDRGAENGRGGRRCAAGVLLGSRVIYSERSGFTFAFTFPFIPIHIRPFGRGSGCRLPMRRAYSCVNTVGRAYYCWSANFGMN